MDDLLERAMEAARSLLVSWQDADPTGCDDDSILAAALLRFTADMIERPGHGADEGCLAHAIKLRAAADKA